MIGRSTSTTAIIIFAHGAREAAWAKPFHKLKEIIQARHATVELAFLELMQPSLETAVNGLVRQGIKKIKVVPVFFGEGGHLKKHVPSIIDAVRSTYPGLVIQLAKPVGEAEPILEAIANYALQTVSETKNDEEHL